MREHEAAARRLVAGGAVILVAALAALGLATVSLLRLEAHATREAVQAQVEAAVDEFCASLAQPRGPADPTLIQLDRNLESPWMPIPFDRLPAVGDAEGRFYLDAAEQAATPALAAAAARIALASSAPSARVRAASFLLRAALREGPGDAPVRIDWPDPRIPQGLRGTAEAVFYEYVSERNSAATDRMLRALGTSDDATAASLFLHTAKDPVATMRFVADRRRLSRDVVELPSLVRATNGRVVTGREIRVRFLASGEVAVAWTEGDGWILRRVDAATVVAAERRILDPVGVRITAASAVPADAPRVVLDDVVATKEVRSGAGPSTPLTLGLVVAGLAALVAFAAFVRAVRRETKAAAARADFVATVSHELRTPVAVVRTSAETLLAGRALRDEDRTQLLGAILREAERLSVLVGNVLDFSRIDAGTRRYAFRETALGNVIEETVRRTEAAREAAGFHVAVEIPALLPRIVCDADAIGAALANLLDNAVKFRGTGDHAEVRATATEGAVEIEVEDHGVGVPDAEKAHVFDRFFRGAAEDVRGTRGSGIGLSLVQHAAEAHGGRVEVTDTHGGGATFRIVLPLGAVEAAQVAGGHR